MEGKKIVVDRKINPVDSVELGGHQRGGRIDKMRGVDAPRSGVFFRAGGEEKLLVL